MVESKAVDQLAITKRESIKNTFKYNHDLTKTINQMEKDTEALYCSRLRNTNLIKGYKNGDTQTMIEVDELRSLYRGTVLGRLQRVALFIVRGDGWTLSKGGFQIHKVESRGQKEGERKSLTG